MSWDLIWLSWMFKLTTWGGGLILPGNFHSRSWRPVFNLSSKHEEQIRPWRFRVRQGRTSAWRDNFTAQADCYRFQIMYMYSWVREKTTWKRHLLTEIFMKMEKNIYVFKRKRIPVDRAWAKVKWLQLCN